MEAMKGSAEFNDIAVGTGGLTVHEQEITLLVSRLDNMRDVIKYRKQPM